MAKGFTLELEGLRDVLKDIENMADDIKEEIDVEIESSVTEMEAIAKRNAPDDIGFLRSKITKNREGFLDYELVSRAFYSPYLEFGTKTYVKVPSGLENYAAQFRGKGKGNMKEFVEKLAKWAKRKGIAVEGKNKEKAYRNFARYLAIIILKRGIKPQPFFFPAIFAVRPKMIENIKSILNEKRG